MWRLQVQLDQVSTLGPFPARFPSAALGWLGREAEAATGPAPTLMATVPASLTLPATIPGQAVIGQAKSHDRLLLPHPAMETRQKWSRPDHMFILGPPKKNGLNIEEKCP